MRNRTMAILMLLLIMPLVHVFSQARGKVYLENDDEPLVGVAIFNTNTGDGTVSDIEGGFELPANIGDSIQFIYTGIDTYSKVYKGKEMKVILKTGNVELGTVVVTALGLKREEKALGYTVESLDNEAISSVKSVNLLDNLTGKISGVQINQGATGVGSSSKITIRGESSFTNNTPLFILDGIPIDNSTNFNITNEAAAGFQEVDFGNGAMDISADDIENISVLKGPNAAALYGSRASNGVVVITTKDGSNTKSKMGISFNSSIFIDHAFRLPKFQNRYGQGNNGDFEFVDGLGGGTNDNITYSYGPELDVGLLIPQYDSPVLLPDSTTVRGGDVAVHGGGEIQATPFVSNPDNLKDFYETGVTNIQNIAVGGSHDKGHYRLSFTNLNSESIIPGVNYKRRNLNARIGIQPIRNLKINTSLNYIHSESDNRPGSGYGSENMNYALVAWMGRQTNLNPMKDYWQPGLAGLQQYSYNYTFFDNPYFTLFENKNAFGKDRFMGMLSATYSLSKKMSVTARTGMDYFSEKRNFRRAFSSNRFRNGAYAENDIVYREQNSDLSFRYQETENEYWNYELILGTSRFNQKINNQQIQTNALAQPGIYNLSNAAVPLESFVFNSEKRINSIFAIAKINFWNFWYVDFTARNDWSSALANVNGADNTSFFYPSISSSFLISTLADLPESISYWKLRASWAAVGNDTQPYQTSNVFEAQTPFGGLPTLSGQDIIANEGLLPERTSSLEFGTDIRFFDDRIRLDATYYQSKTKNQILSLPIAQSTGYNNQVVNGGTVSSKGIEVLLQTTPVLNNDFKWNSDFNFSRNIAEVEELPDGVEQITLGYNRVYDNINQTVWIIASEGSRIGDIWGTGYLKNDDGDFIIGDDGRFIIDNNLKKLGNYNPDFILGWNNEFSYKQFGLGFTFDWRQGGEIVSRTQALAGVAGQLEETGDRPEEGIIANGVQNIGTTENPQYIQNTTAISAEAYYRQFYDRNHEENNTLDASYLKLTSLRLSYNLPIDTPFTSWAENIRLSFVAKNIFAISKIKHFDPEQIAVQGNGFVGGVEDMSYATTRSFGFSLNVNF